MDIADFKTIDLNQIKIINMEVVKFFIEESKVNKGVMILVAQADNAEKFVVSGDHNNSVALIPYDKSWDAIGEEKFKKLHGLHP